MPETSRKHLRVCLFGAHAQDLQPEIASHHNLEVVEEKPDAVISYGGDGTLLAAELLWPGVPKVPILNSNRGHRCIPHPAGDVLAHLAAGSLVEQHYTKLECFVRRAGHPEPRCHVTALNEVNVHMARINSAVRFKAWLNQAPLDGGVEILGDGFLLCTPFGSTAYFNKLTRCVFWEGLGIAWNAANRNTSHYVVPETAEIRVAITRGPALLAFDSADKFFELEAGDELEARKHAEGATLLTYGPVQVPSLPF